MKKALVTLVLIGQALVAADWQSDFSSLPSDIKKEIIHLLIDAHDPQQAGENIHTLQTLNKQWKSLVDDYIDAIIQGLASRFSISPTLAAFYLNTQSSRNWLQHNQPSLKQSVIDLIQAKTKFGHLSRTKDLEKILHNKQVTLDGSRLLFREGILKSDTSAAQGRVVLERVTGELDATWGENHSGKTAEINFRPTVFFQKKNGLILVAGVEIIANGESYFSYATLDENGQILETTRQVTPLKSGFKPIFILADPDVGEMIIFASTWDRKKYAIIQQIEDGTFIFEEIQ